MEYISTFIYSNKWKSTFKKLLYIYKYLLYNTARKILQLFNIITIALRKYYNCVKNIDILAKSYKIEVYHKRYYESN